MDTTTSDSAELCGIKLTMETVHLFPQWFNLVCGVLADKQLFHTVKPTTSPPNPPHARDHAAALVEDPTLKSFTSSGPTGRADAYYGYTNVPNTFPGNYVEQFNARRLIKSTIKHIHGLYLATSSNTTFINMKINVAEFANDLRVLAGLHHVLVELRAPKHLPQIAPHITFSCIKHVVIDGLHSAFDAVKTAMCEDDTICNEHQLLAALMRQESNFRCTPSTDGCFHFICVSNKAPISRSCQNKSAKREE
ncbi:hypothetical protein HDU81_005111 [Chytriomyces hyalinus]|nr:hypothetical protein HDU81_005111 [Chytriomyces hyalinus]